MDEQTWTDGNMIDLDHGLSAPVVVTDGGLILMKVDQSEKREGGVHLLLLLDVEKGGMTIGARYHGEEASVGAIVRSPGRGVGVRLRPPGAKI
jgi:hypothetical protein